MNATTFESALESALRARAPLITLQVSEEERAIEAILAVCKRLQWPCHAFDVAEGFTDPGGGKTNGAPLKDPIAALEHVGKENGDGVYVFKDFHEFWANPQVKRKLRDVVQRLTYTRKSIIITCPEGTSTPKELRNEMHTLDFPLPTVAEHSRVLEHVLATPGVRKELTPTSREKLLQAALGLTAAQAQRAFSMAVITDGVMDERAIERVTQEKKRVIAESKALQFCQGSETLDDLGGLDELKKWLRLRLRAFTQEAREYGLPWPKGVALIGIPGSGKSLAVKTIAALWGLPLLRLDAGALYGKLMGESEENARRAIQLAEIVAPCVVWIDEMDKALSHGDMDSGTSTRVFGSILTWMAEKTAPCFVAATANDISKLPPELLRKGRFDEVFFLDLPTMAERKAIFAVHLRKRGRKPADFDLERLARESESFVGAEVEQAVIDALYVGFSDHGRPITTQDILGAIARQVPISVSSREVIEHLRQWLHEGRARSASFPEAQEAERQFVPIDLKRKGNPAAS